jgi:integrase/recombinase XerD
MASIQKFTNKGNRIYWRLYFPDGTFKEKYKTSYKKRVLQELLPEVMKIETLSRRNDLSSPDLFRAINLKLISREELRLLSPDGQDTTDHFIEELRTDFETQSKVKSSNPHSHMANLSKANIVEAYFKAIPLRNIKKELVEQFRNERKRIVTDTTVNHDLKALRAYMDIGVSKGYIKTNPARELTLLSEPKDRIPRCLYPAEIKTFFQGLKNNSHLLHGDITFIMRTLIYTGLRRSELCSLKPENIKLHLRQIHLIGKGKKARIIGIHRSLLKEFVKRTKQGNILPPGIDPSSISHAFKKICRKLGLPEALTLHSLRHTYISYLLEKGVPTKRVQEHAGHFSLTITDRYTHALPSTQVDEDALDFEH